MGGFTSNLVLLFKGLGLRRCFGKGKGSGQSDLHG